MSWSHALNTRLLKAEGCPEPAAGSALPRCRPWRRLPRRCLCHTVIYSVSGNVTALCWGAVTLCPHPDTGPPAAWAPRDSASGAARSPAQPQCTPGLGVTLAAALGHPQAFGRSLQRTPRWGHPSVVRGILGMLGWAHLGCQAMCQVLLGRTHGG